MRLNDIRLSTRITLGMLLLMAVVAGFWIVAESHRLQDAYLIERRVDIEGAMNVEKVRLNQSIEALRQTSVFLANVPPISGIVRATANHGIDPRDNNSYATWEKRLQEIFAAFLRAHPDYIKVRYIGVADSGRELVTVSRHDGSIEVVPREALQAVGGSDYFKAGLALSLGRIHLSEFNLNQELGKIEEPQRPTLRSVTPVFDANGQVYGMVVVNLDVRSVLGLASAGLPTGVQALIADQQGHYLLHPAPGRAFAFETGDNSKITDDFPSLNAMFTAQTPNYQPLQMENGRGGVQYLAAERVYFDPSNPARFLLLAHHLPGQAVAEQAISILMPSVLKTLLVVSVLSGIFMLVLRRTFAPLTRITVAAHEIAAGRQINIVREKGGGEIGELNDALNTMLENLAVCELTEQENIFRKQLIESLPGVFYMIDAEGHFLMWNRNLEQVSQRSGEEIGVSHPLDFIEGEDKVVIEKAMRQVFEEGEGTADADLVAKDGNRIPFHFTGRRIEHDGKPVLVGMGMDISALSEQMRTTEALLQRNQALMRNSMEGIRIVDVEGNIVEVNDAFCKMLGYTREEALRMNVMDWDTQWTREGLRERIQSLIGKSAQFERVHRCKDGSLVDVEITVCGIEFDGQAFMYAASRDITERKKVEELLLRYKKVLDSTHDGFWLVDAQGKLLEANQAYADLTGYALEELIGMHVSQLDAIDDPAVVKARIEKIVEQGYLVFETRHCHKDGHLIDIEISSSPVPGSEQLVVFARDITERKQVEAAMLRHELVIETAMDGFFVSDLQGRLEEVNEAYARMTGYTMQELVGMRISELEAVATPEDVLAHIDKLMLQGYDRFETRHRRKDGSAFDIEVSVTYMPESVKLFVFCRDITERKQAEQELRVAAATFETQDATIITDAQSNIIRVNRSFTRITGYSPEEVIGKNPRIMSSGRHDKEFYAAMWQQIVVTGFWAGEIWDRRKNGEVFPKWMTITAVKNERGDTTQYVAIFNDITQRKQAEDEIRNLAFYDALTQLPNRRLFMDRFHAALLGSARYNDYGAILFIDLDRFKLLNDTLGHDYGDLLLIDVAERIKACVREIDTVARLGGDEFVVLLENISNERDDASHKVGMVAEKIRETLSHPYQLKEHEHYSSPSIGISLFHNDDETMEVLLKHADAAMYQAKNAGRNAVRFYDPTLQHDLETRATLENDLRHAVENKEFQLYYQVQVDNEHHPIGFEALIRWIHPQHGVVSPARFIPIAEDSSLILEIGSWVLETACAQLAAWKDDERMRHLTVAINVSAHQFRLHDFVEQIATALHKHHVEPRRLKLELTEGVVLNDMNEVVVKMLALKGLGVQLSLDDFGTGYSSLTYLKRLPLDQIKIDQSFIRDITVDSGDAVMVHTIIDMARNFNHDVIAEGVETEAQLAFLKHHECMAYQGYFFSKPLPVEELQAMMENLR